MGTWTSPSVALYEYISREKLFALENSLCPIKDVMHHDVEWGCMVVLDMLQCVDMALINVQKGVHWEVHRLVKPTAPFIKSSIQLGNDHWVPLWNKMCHLPLSPLRPPLGLGPRTPRHRDHRHTWGTAYMNHFSGNTLTVQKLKTIETYLTKRWQKDCVPPAKYKSRITVMIRMFRYGRVRMGGSWTPWAWEEVRTALSQRRDSHYLLSEMCNSSPTVGFQPSQR